MAKKQRTDEHRPGAIVPANYQVAVSYSTGDRYYAAIGMAVVGMHEMCAAALGQKVFGSAGKCGVCGARYKYGDLWIHMTGDLVHVGHECSEKYLGWTDRTEWQLAHERELAKSKVLRARDRAAEKRAAFLAANPDLVQLLATDHHIVRDIAARYEQTGKLSDAQVDLVRKLAREQAERAAKKAERAREAHVPAPTGRQTFLGKIVNVKVRDGFRGGIEYKAVIVVPTASGTWTAWSTIPAVVLDGVGRFAGLAEYRTALVGATVEVTATLKQSDREAHFAFASRPIWRVFEDGQLPVPAPKGKDEIAAVHGTEYHIEVGDILFPKIAAFSSLWQLGVAAQAERAEVFGLALAGL